MELLHATTLSIIATLLTLSQGDNSVRGTQTPQKRLLGELLDNYGVPSLRPVRNLSSVVVVNVRLLVAQVIRFDERSQQLQISAWMKQDWTDELLTWNTSMYDDVDMLALPMTNIWSPDITLYENVHGEFEQFKTTNALVTSDGHVNWYAPVILTVSCKVKVRYFPFDRQTCRLRFASWMYDKSKMNIIYVNDSDSMQSVFYSNGVWNLVSVHAYRSENKYACCSNPFAFVTFNLLLKRESAFYVFNIVIPCVLLAVLTLMVFCLPPDSGEKISFGTANLLALILYQQLIADSMPPLGDEVSLVGMYFFSLVVIGCLSIFGTVCILKIWHINDTHPFPPVLRRLLRSPIVSCVMSFDGKVYSFKSANKYAPRSTEKGHSNIDCNSCDVYSISEVLSTSKNGTTQKEIKSTSRQNHVVITNTVNSTERNERKNDGFSEWQQAALILDRIVFVTLCLATISVFVSVMIMFILQES